MSHRRSVVIVGIPGVGKSSVVNKIVELLEKNQKNCQVVNFGTMMFEQAKKTLGVKTRDDIRKLPVEDQRVLQKQAAEHISRIQSEYLIVDTHLFIATPEGFWPGMPMEVLQALRPTHLVLISASLQEIEHRRLNDPSRVRDRTTTERLSEELEAAKTLLFASSLVCGCPAIVFHNEEGRVEGTAEKVINAVFPV